MQVLATRLHFLANRNAEQVVPLLKVGGKLNCLVFVHSLYRSFSILSFDCNANYGSLIGVVLGVCFPSTIMYFTKVKTLFFDFSVHVKPL